jgi:hypothetical protein
LKENSMKKHLAFSLIASLLSLTLIVSTPAVAAPTSIANGDFEIEESQPDTITGWTTLNERIDLGTDSIAGCTSVDTSDYSNFNEYYAEAGREYFDNKEYDFDDIYDYDVFVNWDFTIDSGTVNEEGTAITYTGTNSYDIGDVVRVEWDEDSFDGTPEGDAVFDGEVTASDRSTFTVEGDYDFYAGETSSGGGRSSSDDYVTALGLIFGFGDDGDNQIAFLQTSLDSARIFEEDWTSAQRAAVIAQMRDPEVAQDSLTITFEDEPEFSIDLLTDESQYLSLFSDMGADTRVNLNSRGYVVHGPAVFSQEFTANTVDDLSFKWSASEDGDDYKVFGYLLNTADCTQTEVLDSTGGAQEWETVTVAIPSNGTYRFVFVSGTYDQNWGSGAGAVMYLDDVTLAPNAERVAAAQTTLAKTGGDFTWLLVPGLMAAVVGSGLVAASRRKRI